MGSTETLCLRWNEFESSIKHGFSVLRSDKDFFDVTLACGSHQIKAHKLILSTCSAFFRTLIKSVPHQHPLLYLRGVDFNNLESVLCFMYSGEVRVNPEDLDQFLSLAQELQVNGLMQDQSSSEVVKSEPTLFNEVKKIEPIFEPTAPKRSLNASNIIKLKKEPSPISNPSKRISTELPDDEDSDIEVIPPSGSSTMMHVSSQEELNDVPNEEDENDEMEPEYTEEESLMNASDSSHKMNELLDEELLKFVSKRDEDKKFKCLKCSLTFRSKQVAKFHVEAKHFITDGFECDKCSRRCKTRRSLTMHKFRVHKKDPEYFSTI